MIYVVTEKGHLVGKGKRKETMQKRKQVQKCRVRDRVEEPSGLIRRGLICRIRIRIQEKFWVIQFRNSKLI